MQLMLTRFWRLSLTDARYYGWRYCLQIGPVILFAGLQNTRICHGNRRKGGANVAKHDYAVVNPEPSTGKQ
jgi:hypothetical protein